MEHQAKDASIHLCGESFLKNSYLVGKIFVGKMLKHVLCIFDSTTTYIFDKGIGDLTLTCYNESTSRDFHGKHQLVLKKTTYKKHRMLDVITLKCSNRHVTLVPCRIT